MKNSGFTYAEIDLGALSHNIAEIRRIIPKKSKFMAVVKANAYGHGVAEVAGAAVSAGVDYLGVASVWEANEIREAGISSPVLILSESDPGSADMILDGGFSQTVYSLELASALSRAAAAKNRSIKVHLKVDTGMGRVGALPSETEELLSKIKNLPGLNVEGFFTHFAKADDGNSDYTARQLSLFKDLASKVESTGSPNLLKHAANSAAALYCSEAHLDMVRIGLAMYGLYPRRDKNKVTLKPALSFKTEVRFKKKVPAGTLLSYGSTHKTSRETNIATLPVGYADGYSRLLSNKSHVLIKGKKFPVVGRVCMDMTLVDVGDERVEIGDEVVLIGSQGKEKVSADDIADIMGTISYEVVCGIGKRVPRIYKK
jgi:alanine racemase